MKTIFNLVLFIGLVSLSNNVKGQFNFRSGYVITLDSDTLFGKIYDNGSVRNSKLCLFKSKGKLLRYYPEQIKSYRIYGDKYFSSKQLFFKEKNRYIFTEVLLEGEINLFYDWRNKFVSYYIEKGKDDLKSLINVKIRLRPNPDLITNGYSIYDNMDDLKFPFYQDTLLSIFNDSKEIKNQISNVKYNHKSLINITKEYINETCKGRNCITYEKDLGKYRPRFGFFSGIEFNEIQYILENGENINPEVKIVKSSIFNTYPIGAFYNLPLTSIGDRVSFQIELITIGLNYKFDAPDYKKFEIKSRTLEIPISLKYEIPRKILSPSISIGRTTSFVFNSTVNLYSTQNLLVYSNQKGDWFFDLGFDYKINQKNSLFSTFRFQSYQNLVVDELHKRYSYSNLLEYHKYLMEYETKVVSLYLGVKF